MNKAGFKNVRIVDTFPGLYFCIFIERRSPLDCSDRRIASSELFSSPRQ